ncbi:MAG: hypothetical protein QOF37_936 [Thermoleophilaceae bacterium]|jgi:predicted small secreted protein|nr:hypothetical protein [Thermoleophilaceae bacterium]
MTKRLIPLLAAAAALALAGCNDTQGVDVKQVRSVVNQFAESGGPNACALLSPSAVVNLYGGFTQPVTQARKSCVAQSKSFRGQAVTINTVNVVDPNTVKVGATNKKGDITYSVTVRKFGPSWRIDDVRQAKTKP